MSPHQPVLLRRYLYDPLDRLAGYHNPDLSIQRFYCKNHLATEVQADVQRSIFRSGDKLLAQKDSAAGVHYLKFLFSDQQRSISGVLGTNGQMASFSYSAFGFRRSGTSTTSQMGFTGEAQDCATGLYLLGNGYRAYSPVLMRFISPDNLGPFTEAGVNPYAYCLGDPINRRDPSGHSSVFLSLAKMVRLFVRARIRSTAAAAEIKSIQAKNTVARRPYGTYTLRPNTSPEDAIKARDRIFQLEEQMLHKGRNDKFMKDLQTMQNKKTLNADEGKFRNFLGYIKRRQGDPQDELGFSFKRMADANEGVFDSTVQPQSMPSPEVIGRYQETLKSARTHQMEVYPLSQRADQIRDEYFVKEP